VREVEPSLMVKKDGMILEHTSYRRNRVAEKIPFSAESNKRGDYTIASLILSTM